MERKKIMDMAERSSASVTVATRDGLPRPSKASAPTVVAASSSPVAAVGEKASHAKVPATTASYIRSEKSVAALQALRAVRLSAAHKTSAPVPHRGTAKAAAPAIVNASRAMVNCGRTVVSDTLCHPMVPNVTNNIRPAAITTPPKIDKNAPHPLSISPPSALMRPEANGDVSTNTRDSTSAPIASTPSPESLNRQENTEKPYQQRATRLTNQAAAKAVDQLNSTQTSQTSRLSEPTTTADNGNDVDCPVNAPATSVISAATSSPASNLAPSTRLDSTSSPLRPTAGGPSSRVLNGRPSGGGLYGLRSTRLTNQVASKATAKVAAALPVRTSSPNVVPPPVSIAVPRVPSLPGIVEQECDTPPAVAAHASATLSDSSVSNASSTASTESSNVVAQNAVPPNSGRVGNEPPLLKGALPRSAEPAPRPSEKAIPTVSRPASAASKTSKKQTLADFNEKYVDDDGTLSIGPITDDASTRASMSSQGSLMTHSEESLSRPSSSVYSGRVGSLVGTDEVERISNAVTDRLTSVISSTTTNEPSEPLSFHTRTAPQEHCDDSPLPALPDSVSSELAAHAQPLLPRARPSAPSTPPATFLEQQRRDFTQMEFASPQGHLPPPPPPRCPSLRPRLPPAIAPPPTASWSVPIPNFLPATKADMSVPLMPPPPLLTRKKFTDLPLAADAPREGPEKSAVAPIPPLPPQAPKAPPETPAFPKIAQPPKVTKDELPLLFKEMPTIVDKDTVPAPHNILTKHLFIRGPLHKLTVLGYICANLLGSKTEQWTAALNTGCEGRGKTSKEAAHLLNRGFAFAGHPLVNVDDIFAFAGTSELPNAQIACRRAGVPKLHLTGIQNPKPQFKPVGPTLPVNYLKFDPDYDVELANSPDEYENILDYRRKRAWQRFRSWFSWCGGGDGSEWDQHDRVRAAALLLGVLLFTGSIFLYKLGRIQPMHVRMSFGFIEIFLIVAAISSALFGLFLSRKALAPRYRTDYAAVGAVIRRFRTKHRRKVHFEDRA
eukprot:GEMP01003799.1.p1 GENE.GEMP01003799.1~~GEMP01003799.1.p1  ORF type:complete len:1008 (+),score=219.17 GEMP01003799.1:453-3476(+)